MTHRVGVLGGDGIGPEVIAEGLKVIQAAGVELDTVDYDLGGARYLRDGTVLDGKELRSLMCHPLLKTMLSNLVFWGEEGLQGYPVHEGKALQNAKGDLEPVSDSPDWRICGRTSVAKTSPAK